MLGYSSWNQTGVRVQKIFFHFFSEDSNAFHWMNKGLKEDFPRIWNVVWKLGYIRCRGGPKLYAGKRHIWCTMKIISKISSTCMSWISLHEEAPARSLKMSLIRRNCKLFFSYISIHHWETRLTAIWLIDRRISLCSKLCFLTGKSHSLYLAVCMFSLNRSLIRNSVGRGSIVIILIKQ